MIHPGSPDSGPTPIPSEADFPAPRGDGEGCEEPPAQSTEKGATRMAPAQAVIAVLGAVAFLYFARPVVLPVLLAWFAAMTLQPLVRRLSILHLPAAVSAAIIFSLLLAAVGAGFFQLERPAARWMNEAPEHMTELRQRVQKLFPRIWHFSQAREAVGDLGATEAEKKEERRKIPVVEISDQRGTASILNWTGTVLTGLGEVLVLIYLLLASGDLFLQKIAQLVPTLRGKIRAVEICHEMQQNISNYLFSITLINICLGGFVSVGLYAIGIPNAAMWGILVALLNYVPYFGSTGGVVILAAVGLLTFDSPWKGLLAPLWYLVLHLLESNLVTPILLGRRLTLNPVAIFVSLIFWIWLWGIPGAILSVPILVSVKVICDRMPSVSFLGEFIGR